MLGASPSARRRPPTVPPGPPSAAGVAGAAGLGPRRRAPPPPVTVRWTREGRGGVPQWPGPGPAGSHCGLQAGRLPLSEPSDIRRGRRPMAATVHSGNLAPDWQLRMNGRVPFWVDLILKHNCQKSQLPLRHGLVSRLCIPCRGVVGPLRIPACRDIGSEAHLFLRQRWCLLARPKWIRLLHKRIHLLIAVYK